MELFLIVPVFTIWPGAACGKEPSCQCKKHKRHGKIPWRRAWQTTLVFLPGESHRLWSLMGYCPQGHKELHMTNLDSILKSRNIILSTKVCLVKAMVFPVVMYGCESWTIKKAERRRIDAFELWCWGRLLRVPWTARRSNQSILKEISPGCSLEGLMLKRLNSNTLAT